MSVCRRIIISSAVEVLNKFIFAWHTDNESNTNPSRWFKWDFWGGKSFRGPRCFDKLLLKSWVSSAYSRYMYILLLLLLFREYVNILLIVWVTLQRISCSSVVWNILTGLNCFRLQMLYDKNEKWQQRFTNV